MKEFSQSHYHKKNLIIYAIQAKIKYKIEFIGIFLFCGPD